MKSVVVIFPGSNCDRDLEVALKTVGSRVNRVWHKESKIDNDVDLIAIPGGFSYGDYLRSGAMASISSIMQEVIRLARKGVKIIGICNGFQILIESRLLDGVLLRNRRDKFICKNVFLKVNNKSIFTSNYKEGDIIEIPIAHMDGRYFADDDIIKKIQDNNQIAFQYCDSRGALSEGSNINGSLNNIAGIFNKSKNILGMMPHPERAVDSNTGLTYGLNLFESLKVM